MALSTVFHSITSPNNSPSSQSGKSVSAVRVNFVIVLCAFYARVDTVISGDGMNTVF